MLLPDLDGEGKVVSPMHQVVAPRTAIELEVYFVDRRANDPLIGESLWSSLYAMTSVSPEIRQNLQRDGFRFAMAPSRPPRALQALLNLSNEQDPSRRVLVRRYVVPSGQQTLLVTSNVADGTELTHTTSDGERRIVLNKATCLLKVNAEMVEDGWARLTVIPEIHHGTNSMRPQATDQAWMLMEGQETLPFYNDRLTADLNLGEIVVVGLDPRTPQGVASHFFRSNPSQDVERLILIRVADIRIVEPVRVATY